MNKASRVIIQGWMATIVAPALIGLSGLVGLVGLSMLGGCQEVELARHSPWDDFDLADQPANQGVANGDLMSAVPNGTGGEGGAGEDAPTLTPLVINNDDGSVTLNAFLPEHVVTHLRNCLIESTYDVIYDQLVAASAKDRYIARGLDAEAELTEWFEANRRELLLMLRYIPAGIDSPNVLSEVRGSIYRLKIHDWIASKGAGDGPLRYQTLELEHAGGRFYLRTIY